MDQDLSRRNVVESVLHLLRLGVVFMVHFGLDCSTWSIIRARFGCGSRSKARPWGNGSRKDEIAANHVLRNVFLIIKVCNALNVFWTLENPKTSRVFNIPAFQTMLVKKCVTRVDLDMCSFGLRDPVSDLHYLKPTSLIGTLPGLSILGKRCQGEHIHETVEGTVLSEGKVLKRSKVAGGYTLDFCAQFVSIISNAHTWAHDYREARLGALASSRL
jgi:hypothetical protein